MNKLSTHWLTRIIFLRCLGLLYFVAFLVSMNQNSALIGDHGLTPANRFVEQISLTHGATTATNKFLTLPTIFWFVSPSTIHISIVSWLGLLISFIVTIAGSANVPMLSTLWLLYLSIVNIGQTWYSFGWESQLLEIGFLSIFLVPWIQLNKFSALSPPPLLCIIGCRWLLFRIMLGAGLIKIRGDSCWRDLTCMNYFYVTQPVPNPFSPAFHFSTDSFHQLETIGNHFIELVLPWFLLLPSRPFRLVGGAVQIAFQMVLISAGNLSFLNWLTALPAVMCFDDVSLAWIFSRADVEQAQAAEANFRAILTSSRVANKNAKESPEGSSADHAEGSNNNAQTHSHSQSLTSSTRMMMTTCRAVIMIKRLVCLGVAAMIVTMSIPVLRNLLSPAQAMNTSFSPFRFVNTYGAFGSVTRVRHEVVLQGTRDSALSEGTQWLDFEFKCKPGDINRRPCFISPYHYRLDWLMWFAAFQDYNHNPWLVHLVQKLLVGGEEAALMTSQLALNPFGAHDFSDPPKFIRVELYEYEFSRDKSKSKSKSKDTSASASASASAVKWEEGRWWRRRHVRNYLPALSANDSSVLAFLAAHQLLSPAPHHPT